MVDEREETSWQQALEVGSCPGHESMSPCDIGPAATLSAEEYLQLVRNEAAQMPSVLVSRESPKEVLVSEPVPSSSRDGTPNVDGVGSLLSSPSLEYDDLKLGAFVSEFADLRRKFRNQVKKLGKSRRAENNSSNAKTSPSAPPKQMNRELWFEFCFGPSSSSSSSKEEDSNRELEGPQCWGGSGAKPLLSVLDSISQPKTRWLLQQMVERVSKRYQRHSEAETEAEEMKQVLKSEMETSKVSAGSRWDPTLVSDRETLWIFALSVKVNKPLDDDTSASYRSLVKFCLKFLTRNSKQNQNQDRIDQQEADGNRDRLKLLLAISGAYFGQDEVLSQCFANHLRL